MEIDCPECKGKGETVIADRSYYPPEEGFHNCKNCNGTGKITVYTEEELQERIEIAIAKNDISYMETFKLFQNKLSTLYTEKELQEAVKDQKEKDVLICEKIFSKWENYSQLPVLKECAKAIRNRK